MSLVVIDNGSAETESLDYLSDLSARGEAKVLRDGRSFNWARMNNEAASEAEGDVLVFLNNDTVVISDRWCDELCYWASRDNVGGAGGRLLYADGTIQHAGIVLGGEAIARHEGAGLSASDAGYMGRHSLSRRASAVTGACLATRATVFSKLGGFDAASFPIVYNDVDYCLRLQREGFHVVYTPHALLYHFESRSRGHDSEASTGRHAFAIAELRRRWGREIESDRAYNRHFDREATPFSSLVAPAKTTL